MYRLPNQFHTPASQAQRAAGGGCSSCCCCCVVTFIGSNILGAIHFVNIKAEQTQDQETLQNIADVSESIEASSLPAAEHLPETSPSSENKSQTPDTRIVRGLLGFFALPFALYAAWQIHWQSLFFIAPLIFAAVFSFAYYLARSSPLKGVVTSILWMICLVLLTPFEIILLWFLTPLFLANLFKLF